ncbi:unnamed protein product [Amoebophrya sp. A120]|nr:unnamed protein product [Amoebophrya sp. A120]|eukprot:GSA120T00020218001.1
MHSSSAKARARSNLLLHHWCQRGRAGATFVHPTCHLTPPSRTLKTAASTSTHSADRNGTKNNARKEHHADDPFERIQPNMPEEDWIARVREKQQSTTTSAEGFSARQHRDVERDQSAQDHRDADASASSSTSSRGSTSSSTDPRGRENTTHQNAANTTSSAVRPSAFPDPFPEFVARDKFAFDFYPHWWLGHMSKAKVDLKKRVERGINLILEVRDARAPFSSCQGELLEELGFKDSTISQSNIGSALYNGNSLSQVQQPKRLKKLTIFNKVDLISAKDARRILGVMRELGKPALLISASEKINTGKIREFIVENCDVKHNTVGLWMMVVGLPNVGKSTIINGLKQYAFTLGHKVDPDIMKDVKMNEAKTNMLPGTTRHCKGQSTFLISRKPMIHCVDTPGMMLLKNVENLEKQTNLCLLGVMPDHLVGEWYLADYCLFKLNKMRQFQYVKALDLPSKQPTNSIDECVKHLAEHMQPDMLERGASVDLLAGVRWFLRFFRQGHFGPVILDNMPSSSFAGEVALTKRRAFITEPPNPWKEKYDCGVFGSYV